MSNEREAGTWVDNRLNEETNAIIRALLAQGSVAQEERPHLTRRVADRATRLASHLGIDPEQAAIIRKAAFLRDIGKAGIPDSILRKKGPLTAREFDEVRTRMLPEDDVEDSERVQAAIMIALHHHERVDGEGYPDGLSGEYIPLGSRILAVAEAYETMLVDVPWRPARTTQAALDELNDAVGTQFDGEVVEALVRDVREGLDKALA